jgi:hypothetical protein
MKISEFIEKPDGSAVVTFETDPEETKFLVGYAILDILKKQMERSIDDEDVICPTVPE